MLSAFIALIGAIPGISTLIATVTTAVFNSKVAIIQARLGADRDVAVAVVQAAAQQEVSRSNALGVFAGSKVLSGILLLMITPPIIFEWKVFIWDTILGWGTTPPIHGQVADWSNTVIAFLFGSTTLLTLGNMFFNKIYQAK